jgi:hypothetical protein
MYQPAAGQCGPRGKLQKPRRSLELTQREPDHREADRVRAWLAHSIRQEDRPRRIPEWRPPGYGLSGIFSVIIAVVLAPILFIVRIPDYYRYFEEGVPFARRDEPWIPWFVDWLGYLIFLVGLLIYLPIAWLWAAIGWLTFGQEVFILVKLLLLVYPLMFGFLFYILLTLSRVRSRDMASDNWRALDADRLAVIRGYTLSLMIILASLPLSLALNVYASFGYYIAGTLLVLIASFVVVEIGGSNYRPNTARDVEEMLIRIWSDYGSRQ